MPDFFVSSLADPSGRSRVAFDWSNLRARQTAGPNWTAPQALFAILFAAATCDGAVDPREQDALITLARRSRALGALGQDGLEGLNVEIVARLRADRAGAVDGACAALPADMRLAAFAHALDIVLADGDVSAPEAAFLNGLTVSLGLAMDDVERVADVLTMKNAI